MQLAKGDRANIAALTGCLFPCTFTQYRVVASKTMPWQHAGLFVHFGDLATTVRKEVYVYPLLSLVSDFGGSLGLFVGFSFFSLWDQIRAIFILGGSTLK